MYDRDNHRLFIFTIVLVPYFVLTEFLPALVVASTISKFSKALAPRDLAPARERIEGEIARVIQDMRRNAPNQNQ